MAADSASTRATSIAAPSDFECRRCGGELQSGGIIIIDRQIGGTQRHPSKGDLVWRIHLLPLADRATECADRPFRLTGRGRESATCDTSLCSHEMGAVRGCSRFQRRGGDFRSADVPDRDRDLDLSGEQSRPHEWRQGRLGQRPGQEARGRRASVLAVADERQTWQRIPAEPVRLTECFLGASKVALSTADLADLVEPLAGVGRLELDEFLASLVRLGLGLLPCPPEPDDLDPPHTAHPGKSRDLLSVTPVLGCPGEFPGATEIGQVFGGDGGIAVDDAGSVRRHVAGAGHHHGLVQVVHPLVDPAERHQHAATVLEPDCQQGVVGEASPDLDDLLGQGQCFLEPTLSDGVTDVRPPLPAVRGAFRQIVQDPFGPP